MSPSGAVTSVERFTWSYPLAHGGWFVVQVRSEGDPVAAPILDSGPLRQAQWTPSQGELAALPPRFAWQVLAYDGSGSLELASPSPSVSR
jgi:hypothetical protein